MASRPKLSLLAPVQAVGLVNKQHAAQGASDHLLGQGGGVAHVPAHQIRPAHLHQLAAPQRAHRFQILAYQPGNGGFAGARVAGKDHVHGQAARGQALGLAAALHPHMVGQPPHIGLDLVQAHDFIQFRLHPGQRPGGFVHLGQQGPGLVGAKGRQQLPLLHRQHYRQPGLRLPLQQVLAHRLVHPVAESHDRLRAPGRVGHTGRQVPHLFGHGQGHPQPLFGPAHRPVQLARRQHPQALRGKGGGGAHVPPGRRQRARRTARPSRPGLYG